MEEKILIAWDLLNPWEKIELNLKMANRHWLIFWATWTGKTVTMQVLAEQFSKAWVPVFASDVKWDLSWICVAWENNKHIEKRLKHIWIKNWEAKWFPTIFWDLYGKRWHQLRTTVSEMGPILFSRILKLSETQENLVHIAFKIADENWWLLLDLDDMEAILNYMEENSKILKKEYWSIRSVSIWTIRRKLLILREAWGENFFWEVALVLNHIMKKDVNWNWIINILDSRELMSDTRLYSTFLLWLLSELFEQLPEVWDIEKPKLVFFFDEAHLLFRDAPKILIGKIEQVVRLIRSKWVWVYFVTQNPWDIPELIRWQLANRIGHSLRAFTPKDRKNIKLVAENFRANPDFDIKEALTNMEVWVGLISFLNEKWIPEITKQWLIRPPESMMWEISEEIRKQVIGNSPFYELYNKKIDRVSAEENLEKMEKNINSSQPSLKSNGRSNNVEKETNLWEDLIFGTKKKQGFVETVARAVMRKSANKIATKITRWILGGILK